MKTLIEFFTRQSLFGILLAIAIVGVGLVASLFIRREVFPNVSFDVIAVTTIYPGSTAEEAEQLVTNVIEKEVRELDGIEKLESHSVAGRSLLVVQLDPDDTTEEEMKSDLRDIVDRVKPKLPEDAEEPTIASMESKQRPIVEVGIYGRGLTKLELRTEAKRIEEALESISGVARVDTYGLRDLEIRVETSLEKLQRYHLSLQELIQALKQQNVSIPGGTIEASLSTAETRVVTNEGSAERIVRTSGQFQTLKDVEDTVIRANDIGRSVRVKDVAKVSNALEKSSVFVHTNGADSIRLQVIKKEKADAIRIVDQLKEKMTELEPTLKDGVGYEYLNDTSFLIRRRLKILTTNLMVGLGLVLIILSFLLPWRVALIVAIGIPFSFFGTIYLFDIWGYSINLISLIGLIIVSGMLVDDAIVVTDNCINHMEKGLSPVEAAIKGAHEIWLPVTAAVLTTIVVFLPMMFMSGIFGKFVKEIPTGVVIALLFSLLEAFFILPGHIGKWVRSKDVRAKEGQAKTKAVRVWEGKIVPAYLSALRATMKRRYLVAFVVFFLFMGSLAWGFFGLKLILFPADDVEIFTIRAQTETGTSLEQTEQLFKPIEQAISSLPKSELKNFITTIGLQGMGGAEILTRGSEYAQALVFLTPPNTRERNDSDIIKDLRERVGKPANLKKVTFSRVNPGPPVGKPISLGIRGKSYDDILPAMNEVQRIVSNIDGATDITNGYILGKEELQIKVNKAEAAAAGISIAQIGSTVRAAFEGIVATTVRKLDEEIAVRVSLSEQERASKTTLANLKIPNGRGYQIPLSAVAQIEKSQGLADYAHENFQRQVKVTGEVDDSITTSREINTYLQSLLPELNKKFPKVSIAFGGEAKDTRESMISLARAFAVALIGVLLLLVLTFRQLLQPLVLIVGVTIPMGIMSVIWAFTVHNKPLTFMGLLGVIALSGVIVNNAIVFIDFVNQRRKLQKMDRWESILEAAKARIRPIVLTTITTAVGLLPTTYGIGGLDRFVVYITMALSWGLLFGSFLTAFVLPSAMAILDDVLEWMARFSRKPANSEIA